MKNGSKKMSKIYFEKRSVKSRKEKHRKSFQHRKRKAKFGIHRAKRKCASNEPEY